MKLSIEHRKKKSKRLAVMGLPYIFAVIVMWRANGSMANTLWDKSAEEESDRFKRRYTHGGKRGSPNRFRILTTS